MEKGGIWDWWIKRKENHDWEHERQETRHSEGERFWGFNGGW